MQTTPSPPGGTGGTIRTPDQRLRVFISSTLGEMAAERAAVARAITSLRQTPVLFELGARPHAPRELYRAYLAQSDIFIGLYWERYGLIARGMEVSGLEDEFTLSGGLPRLLYVKAPAPSREPRLDDLLSRIEHEASYRVFHTPAELGRLVRDDLATLLSERFVTGREPVPAPRASRSLPVRTTSLVGRDADIAAVAALVAAPDTRLVTLTGPGGIGKTRLALAVGEHLRERFPAGTMFVSAAAAGRRELVLAGIAVAAGAEAGAAAVLDRIAARLGDGDWLLILDNLEQVLDVAPDLDALLARCPGLTIVATSRTVLDLRAEREYPVPALTVPDEHAGVGVGAIAASPAVALFVERARTIRHDFALTEANAAAVADICRRLEGLPLAIELAAARTRLLEPDSLLRRLDASLDALGRGSADMPARQRTLRATVEWSVDLLDEDERALIEMLAVFADGWTIEAAAVVGGLDEERALDLVDALARHSLVQVESTELGRRSRMLTTIRELVAGQLSERPDAAQVRRRHAEYYRTLIERADQPLRGAGVGHGAWLDRLDAEVANLAAACRWFATHEPERLPHLFRILFAHWTQRDHSAQARLWIEEMAPDFDALDAQSRAELLWASAVTARDVGDGPAAAAARDSLVSLLDGLGDPFLEAVSELATAWVSSMDGEYEVGVRQALASAARLGEQDEPVWTAVAVGTAATLEAALGRYDEAQRHLDAVRDVAERFANDWLAAWAAVGLGAVAVARGRWAEARLLLDEGLALGTTARNTLMTTMAVSTIARLALAEGDPERAALLLGAVDGMRERAAVRAWPSQRGVEAASVAQARKALGADRFTRLFAEGAALGWDEARAIARRPASG